MWKQGLKMKPDYASLFLKMLTLATWAQIYATLDITTRQHTLTPKGSLSLGTKQEQQMLFCEAIYKLLMASEYLCQRCAIVLKVCFVCTAQNTRPSLPSITPQADVLNSTCTNKFSEQLLPPSLIHAASGHLVEL